jgi:hypothetical protein
MATCCASARCVVRIILIALARYSEHVIYDVARCRLRFLLLVKFIYNE